MCRSKSTMRALPQRTALTKLRGHGCSEGLQQTPPAVVTGLQLNLFYYWTKWHSNTAFNLKRQRGSWATFRGLQDAMCANSYERWAKVIAEISLIDDKTLAENIRRKLNEKFDWFVCSVVHGIPDTCDDQGRSTNSEHSNKRIHLVARAEADYWHYVFKTNMQQGRCSAFIMGMLRVVRHLTVYYVTLILWDLVEAGLTLYLRQCLPLWQQTQALPLV